VQDGASPYWKSATYKALVANKWDVIIVMLGTNDARDVGSGGPEHWYPLPPSSLRPSVFRLLWGWTVRSILKAADQRANTHAHTTRKKTRARTHPHTRMHARTHTYTRVELQKKEEGLRRH
jgi:hypothetical protein